MKKYGKNVSIEDPFRDAKETDKKNEDI